jgi:predicted enzyme related to lactoylglutathione lyase
VSARVVHLELHTSDLHQACAFYRDLLDWDSEQIGNPYGVYQSLEMGGEMSGGVVECGVERALWLPYVEVERVAATTDKARLLGASVTLEPREGPAGWRSVITTPAGGELALWQPKR